MPRLKKGAIIDPGENWPAFDGGFTMEASGSAGAGSRLPTSTQRPTRWEGGATQGVGGVAGVTA